MSLNTQFYLLIHTILYGVFIGLTFDTTSQFVQKVKRKITVDLIIILYWVLQLPIAIWYFHQVNNGKFQSYLIIFVFVGGVLYIKLIRKNYLKNLKILLKNVKVIVKWAKKALNLLILTPLLFIFRIIFDIIVLPKKILLCFIKKTDDEEDEKEFESGGPV